VSVTGEFLRAVAGCIELLEESDSAAALSWANRLYAARAIAGRDLSTAALRALELDADPERISKIGFAAASDAEAFRERCEHLLAVARVIVGVPSV
jgi:hypothetical protein